jgi:tetratricopeptide (TPR) repeat protein
MELYSTSLWHQQKEIALSALAQDMTALDRNSSSTWCVVGNCFSLQKEHQTAIKYFQRAIQVNKYYCTTLIEFLNFSFYSIKLIKFSYFIRLIQTSHMLMRF